MKRKKRGSDMVRVTHFQEALEGQSNIKILNSLNPDCWRLILDYLTIKELVQSEQTCKDWQQLVLDHISHRPLVVTDDDDEEDDLNTLILRKSREVRCSFKRWVKKGGRSIQELDVDCQYFSDVVEVLRKNCPNLRYLKLKRLKNKLSPTNTLHFQKLTWLVFEYCDEVTDDCVSQFLNSNSQELAIIYNKRVTGRFLNDLKSDTLNRLIIRHCRAFKFPFLLSADRLNNLNVLIFWKRNRSKIAIRDKLHLLLDKMPNLHEVGLEVYDMVTDTYENDRRVESEAFFESVCKLEKMFSLKANFEVWDHQIEALARSCKELAAVNLVSYHITRRGLDALCRHAGLRLYRLNLAESLLTDGDVAACVSACPRLLFLDLYDCPMLTNCAVDRIAEARRDMLMESEHCNLNLRRLGLRLQLTISRWDFHGDEEAYKVSDKRSNFETINALNADCWHLILNDLSIPELLQSERTCKEWQKLVLDHISHRKIHIYSFGIPEKNGLVLRKSTCWPSFKRWLKKCGRSIIGFHPDCYYKDFVEILRNYCPYLESLTLRSLKKKLSPTSTHHFKNLKILSIVNCDELTDDCVNQFVTSNLQELHIRYNKRITGRFLKNDFNQLTDLEIKHCRAFKFPFLLSAANYLRNMDRLVFWKRNRSKIELRNKLHLLLDKMPNLSSVSFVVYDMQIRYDEERSLRETDVLCESLCRLKKLHRVEADFEVWDQHLEALANSCGELACLVFNCDRVTRRGLNSLCRLRGPSLFELRLSKTRITNDDLVALIYACPALRWLDISDCPLLDSAAQRVAAARRDMRATFSNPPPNLKHYRLTLVIRRWDFSGNTEELKDVLEVRYSTDVYTSISRQY